MKKSYKIAVIAALAIAIPGAQTANATAVVGATEPTQILNNVQLGGIGLAEIDQLAQQIQQLQTQIQQYQTMIKNIVQLPAQVWGQVMDAYGKIVNLVDTAESFAYSLSNFDDAFKDLHPDFEAYTAGGGGKLKPVDFSTQYKAWTKEVNASAKMAMKAAGMTSEGVQKDMAFAEKLKGLSESAGGQLEALQAGNQFLGVLNKQMGELRQLAAMQNIAVTQYNTAQQAKETAEQAAEDMAYKAKPTFTSTKRY